MSQLPQNVSQGCYVIRNVSSALQLRDLISLFLVPERWHPGLDDHTLYYNTDPDGFFVGELDGKPIGLISLIKYGDSVAFLGNYIVLKDYRGHGYGRKLLKKVLESFSSYNIALDGTRPMVPTYRRWGFVEAHTSTRVLLKIACSLGKLESLNCPSMIIIQPASEVNFDKLSAYNSDVFGAPHHLFLQGLMNGPNTITMTASNQNGDIIGFVAAQKTIAVEDGWRLTPLYANDGQIARAILRAILKEMHTCEPERELAMLIWTSDTNPDTMILSKEVDAIPMETNPGFKMIRMFTKEPLNTPKKKLYCY